MSRGGLYVAVRDRDLRWELKRAAVNERTTVRELVLRILSAWLTSHGYGSAADAVPSEEACHG